MKIIDMHCDTLYELNKHRDKRLRQNDLMIDLEKMGKSDYLCQNFGIYTNLQSQYDALDHVMDCIDLFYNEIEANSDLIAPARNKADIVENFHNGKMSGMLTLEEGDVIHEDLAILRNYYRLGVRMIALSHNLENNLTSPHTTHKGLSKFGRAYVQEMERIGMIIDVSHMSDECFYDVLEMTTKPFVASHSNARTITNNSRNMSDDMIVKLAERGGVMGINFYAPFLNSRASTSRVQDMVKHILYIKDLAGIDCIGLGTDFDGIDCKLELKHAGEMKKLESALRKAGLTEKEVEKIFYKNVLRVYEKVLG